MKRTLSAALLFALSVTASVVPGIACVDLPEEGKKAPLSTWVGDWRDEVIYQVLVDRFANGDINNDFQVRPGYLARYQGGDWRGLIQHLDYVKELGVTTLWISPVVKNVETDADVDGYHGYWAQDLTKTNPHFGDMSDLRALTKASHERGLKVVLDIVTNHMGQLFFYDVNLNGNPDINLGGTGQCSPEQPGCQGASSAVTRVTEFDPDWDPRGVQAWTSLGLAGRAPLVFVQNPAINRVPPAGILGTARAYHGRGRIVNYDDVAQRELGDFPGGLKDVATEIPEVRAELIDKYTRWVEETDLDGFRIDTVKHVELDFWREFATAVRNRLAPQKKERFLMFGEAFDGNDELLGRYTQEGMLDSVFYFSQHYSVFRDVFQYAHDPARQKPTKQIQDLWSKRGVNYRKEPQPGGIGIAPSKSLVNFMDNHDVARFLFFANGDKPALRNALTFLMTEEGIPCVYYGTEQDFAGGNDPANREVLWNTGFPTGGDTFRHIAKLARIRREQEALRYGDTNVVWATEHVGTESDAGIFAFERTGGDAGPAYALVVFNTNATKSSMTSNGGVSMKVGRAGTTLVDVLNPEAQQVNVSASGEVNITLEPQTALILVPQGE
jgi:alpha-amylase